MDRRAFLQTSIAGLSAAAAAPAQAPPGKTVGIQVGAVSFADEGIEAVLDIFQRRASVNTLFIATFTYGRGIAGRQIPGQPLPDHGTQQYDADTFHGGSYTRLHPEYYRDTVLKDLRAPDLGDFDVLEAVVPAAKKRGMKTVCWFEDVWRSDIPGIDAVQEKDLHGRNAATLCLNNPNYRNFLLGTVEDYARSHDVDGIMWGSERQGPLGNGLGASHGGRSRDPGRVTCFCEFCERKAAALGIDVSRTRVGYETLEKFVLASRTGKRPPDGYFVSFLRILLRYPEILAWEKLWTDSLRETYAAIYRKAKEAQPALLVGWHIWHNNSFSPLYRAEQDLGEFAKYSDFLKVVMYHNCGGERMASYIDSATGTWFADFTKEQAIDLEYRIMNFRERGYDQIPFTGLSSDYVSRETARALAGIGGAATQIWPGIDIDIPTASNHSKSTPQGTREAVLAAFRAGAHGIILSRKYSEMKLANLGAAGEAIRELGLA